MASLIRSDAAVLLTDFEGDAARHPSAPMLRAQQSGAADVVAHAPIVARSPGCTEFAALYDSQARNSRPQTVVGDESRDGESRNSEPLRLNETPAARQPEASSGNASAASDVAYGLMPQTAYIDPRDERRQDRGRPRREPERREEIEPQEQPGYTIDDIVQFAGVTIAERHTPPASLA